MDFKALLDESVRVHGHLCPGQVLGVRMALYGLGRIGIADPKGRDRKKLYLFVEIDRCATDALQSVTGCSLGKRSMRFMDYGKMAATFVNLETGRAVRVVAREDARERAGDYFPGIEDEHRCQMEAYTVMGDEELFHVEEVQVELPANMPGTRLRRVRCRSCGEWFHTLQEGEDLLCEPCSGFSYFRRLGSF
jgi:formylmethanofuran dehydrogenase subunit E